MIKGIKEDTEKALSVMDEEARAVDDGMSLVEEAGSALKNIVEKVGEVSDMIQQIATAAEEQSTAADQISGDIETVARITRESSSGALQIAEVSQEIAKLASNLQELVGMFRVSQEGESEIKDEKDGGELVPLKRPGTKRLAAVS